MAATINNNITPKAIRVHYRNFRRLRHEPMDTRIAHWALQVGDIFYELDRSCGHTTGFEVYEHLMLFEKSRQSGHPYRSRLPQGRSSTSGNQEQTDKENTDDENTVAESPFALEEKKTYTEHTTPVLTLPSSKAPLLISRSIDREKLEHLNSMELGSTRLNDELVKELAIHIFNQAFRYNYNLLHRNGQAFLCFLFAAIQILDFQREQQCKHDVSRCVHPNLTASLASYAVWKQITGEQCSRGADVKILSTPIMSIDWAKVVPPEMMRERLDLHPSWPQKPPEQPHRDSAPAIQIEERPQSVHLTGRASREITRNVQLVVDKAAVLPQQVSQQVAQQMKTQRSLAGFVNRAMGALMPQVRC